MVDNVYWLWMSWRFGGPSWLHWYPGRYFGLTAAFASRWFGVIMIPMLFVATSVSVIAFIAAFYMTDAFVLRELPSGSSG